MTLALTLPLQILYFTPSYWDLQKTLPLQLCDLASFVAIYALDAQAVGGLAGLLLGPHADYQAIITPTSRPLFPTRCSSCTGACT